jgi:ketosteroid isomerase-like protein
VEFAAGSNLGSPSWVPGACKRRVVGPGVPRGALIPRRLKSNDTHQEDRAAGPTNCAAIMHCKTVSILVFVAVLEIAAAAATPAAAAVSAASEQGAVMATVRQFVNGFNAGSIKTMASACASPASIVDDFPPHEWQGPTACADWAKAYAASAARYGISDSVVTLGRPWHVDVTGNRAYVVVPAAYTYRQHGRRLSQSGSVYTLALRKVGPRWLITGWAWADR